MSNFYTRIPLIKGALHNLYPSRKYCSQILTNNHYDIIIAGGGMVGTTLASTLGKNVKLSNKKILLLEGSKYFEWEFKEKYSNRVSALSQHTRTLMESIGAWEHIRDVRFGPVRKMQVWDASSDAMITFNNDDLSKEIAYIVENDVLLDAVTKVIKKIDNVSVVHEAKIKNCRLPKLSENTAEVHLENGDIFTCNLLIGADGIKSKVRESMGVQYLKWEYKQMGVVATLNFSEPCDNNVAWQRFLPTGPIAILPLNENHSSLVWTTTPEHAKQLIAMPEEEFVSQLNSSLCKQYPRNVIVDSAVNIFNGLLESLNFPSNAMRQLPPRVSGVVENSRAAFPFGFGHASNYVAKCVALVGDAAHRVHPLSGQGVNLGFGDVACLSELLGNAVYMGNNIGSISYLHEYESRRQRYNCPTMLAIDGLQKLYNTEMTPVVVLRSLGLQFTHAMNPIKKAILDHAGS